MKLVLENLIYKNQGSEIEYNYSYSKNIAKFFNANSNFKVNYHTNVHDVPESIANIPFVSNFITIAWFAGFDLHVKVVDEDFYNALQNIKLIFQKWYPNKSLKGKLISDKIEKNIVKGNNTALLFSGGVDAFASYIRHKNTNPDLITIHGADIALNDTKQWNELTNFLNAEPILSKNTKISIASNLRTFYTYHVSLLIEDLAWWGKIQHGLSLLGLVSPLSYLNGYSQLIIASSYTADINIHWGSTPETDELISWAGIKVKHDGYELKRQDKVDLIAKFYQENNTPFKLRVCYSELRKSFNCSNCEKCYRTILGLVLAGENPNKFGFNVDETFYDNMYNILNIGSASKGMAYFWKELSQKAKNSKEPYIFANKIIETKKIQEIAQKKIDTLLNKKLSSNKKTTNNRLKFYLRNKFSKQIALLKKIIK
jgi:hypothetical protein